MRVIDLISKAKEYLVAGIVIVAILAIIIAVGYFIVYKKILNGKKQINKNSVIWLIIFGVYLAVVLMATMLDRISTMGFRKNIIPLFYSYKSAWNNFSAIEWRNIILNICMFIPFGLLLPFGIKKAKYWWVTYVCGLIFTVLIESVQLITGRGVFECDDVFNNLLGAMIGYGFYVLIAYIYACNKGNKSGIKKVIFSFVPLFGTIIMFGTIFGIYNSQEFGNLNLNYITKANVKNVSTNEKLSNEKATYPVYMVEGTNKEKSKQFAKEFLENVGDKLDDSLTDLYDETAIYHGEIGNVSVENIDGTYTYTDFSIYFDDEEEDGTTKTDSQVTEDKLREMLKDYGVYIPAGCTFENKGDGIYSLSADKIIEDEIMYNGTIEATCYQGDKIGDINYNIVKCKKLKDVKCISLRDAYDMIKEGKFNYYSNEELDVKVKNVGVDYFTDTKGYYQPVYVFNVDMNGEETQIDIPALKK